jgi:hypothetical protein
MVYKCLAALFRYESKVSFGHFGLLILHISLGPTGYNPAGGVLPLLTLLCAGEKEGMVVVLGGPPPPSPHSAWCGCGGGCWYAFSDYTSERGVLVGPLRILQCVDTSGDFYFVIIDNSDKIACDVVDRLL